MFVALLAVVFTLAFGHLAPGLTATLRDHRWVHAALRRLDAAYPDDGFWRGPYGVALLLVPVVVLVAALQVAVGHHLYGLPALVFGIAALFIAWGPRDLDLDVDAVLDAADPADRLAAATHLWPPGEAVSLAPAALVAATMRCALRRWFGVLLWFLLLGPAGALGYRLVALLAEGTDAHLLPPDNVRGARRLLAVLDWPAAQLMTAAMAVVGHFDGVVAAWKAHGGTSFSVDTSFVEAAALASVRVDVAEERADRSDDLILPLPLITARLSELPELRDAMRLAWRILLAWLCVVAVFVLAGWVA